MYIISMFWLCINIVIKSSSAYSSYTDEIPTGFPPDFDVTGGFGFPGFSTPSGEDDHSGATDTDNEVKEAVESINIKIERETDIPQEAVEDALQIEWGEYSTISFSYYNDRFLGWHQTEPPGYECHDHYVRCILSMTHRHPVCAMHKIYKMMDGVRNLPSMCDLMHYNCRRGYRYYFVLKYGTCNFFDHRNREEVFEPIY